MILLTDEHETNQTITWLPTEFRSAMNAGRLELLCEQIDADNAAEENFPQYEHMFAEVAERASELCDEIEHREGLTGNWSDNDFNDGCINALQSELDILNKCLTAQRLWDIDRKSAKWQVAFDAVYQAWDDFRFPLLKTEPDAEAAAQHEWMMESAG